MPRVMTLGECLGVAITPTGERLRTARAARLGIAGAEATVAIGLSRLGIEATWVGVVGNDEFGARIVRELAGEGVDVATVRRDPRGATAFMVRERRRAEETHVVYFRTASAGSLLGPADVDAAFDRSRPDLLHLTGITAALSPTADRAARHAVDRAADAGVPVSLDVNLRRSLPGVDRTVAFVRDVIRQVDTLFVGDDEADLLTDERDPVSIARELRRFGVREVVVKRGPDGALALADVLVRSSAHSVQVVDVVGAGDSFVAGYLPARLLDRPIPEGLRWASACAAATVGSDGDWEGLPTRAEIGPAIDDPSRPRTVR